MSETKPHIGVLLGGNSTERAVSLKSGAALVSAYRGLGYTVTTIDTADGRATAETLLNNRIDVAVLALHGPGGEDGTIQGLLRTLGIPFTGSGVTTSAVCMDKVLTKRILRDLGLPTPSWSEVTVKNGQIIHRQQHPDDLTPPYFIKPLDTGSSVGVSRVDVNDNIDEFIIQSAKDAAPDGAETRILIEREIRGTEITLSILDKKTFPLIEICPKKGFYSYDNKYTSGNTRYLIPPEKLAETCMNEAIRMGFMAGQQLGCRGLYRVDMIVDADEKPWILEINTIPGLTETSLAPKAAAAAGLTFEALAEQILAGARME
ncbi:MAG: D-alanine--D-alanine ligase [Magnetococcales bacterium]|nr:D-alanine--D-alanine ligase [Magnetococcales bacterium]